YSNSWVKWLVLYKPPAPDEAPSAIIRKPLSTGHLHNCKPICTKCYFLTKGRSRSMIRTTAKGYLCSTIKESGFGRSKKLYRVAICNVQRAAMQNDSCTIYLCNNCHNLEDANERVEETMAINLRREFLV